MRGRKYAEGACGLGTWGVPLESVSTLSYCMDYGSIRKKLIHTYLVSLPFENCLQKDSHYIFSK